MYGLGPHCQHAIFSDLCKCCIICKLSYEYVVKGFMYLSKQPSSSKKVSEIHHREPNSSGDIIALFDGDIYMYISK